MDSLGPNPIQLKLEKAFRYCEALDGFGSVGPDVTATRTISAGEGQGKVLMCWCECSATLVLAFQGSDTLEALVESDPEGKLQEITEPFYFKERNWTTQARVSKPVGEELCSMRQLLVEEVDRLTGAGTTVRHVLLTGRGAGGALAAVAAPWTQMRHLSADIRCMTFNSPRVGNEEFKKAFDYMVSCYSVRSEAGPPPPEAPPAPRAQQLLQMGVDVHYPYTPPREDDYIKLAASIHVTTVLKEDEQEGISCLATDTAPTLLDAKGVVNMVHPHVLVGLLAEARRRRGFVPWRLRLAGTASMTGAIKSGLSGLGTSVGWLMARRSGGVLGVAKELYDEGWRLWQSWAAELRTPFAKLASPEAQAAFADRALHILNCILAAPFRFWTHSREPDAVLDPDAVVLPKGSQASLEAYLKGLYAARLLPAALLCDASYQDAPKFKSLTGLGQAHGTKAQLVEVELLHAQAYVAWKDGTALFVFRGSDSIQDWLLDFSFPSYPIHAMQPALQAQGRRGHLGFLLQFQSLLDPHDNNKNLAKVLHALSGGAKVDRVISVGHSLGGALATIGAGWAALQYPEAEVRCLALASPRVGNCAFVESIEKLTGIRARVVNQMDAVTHVPVGPNYCHMKPKVAVSGKAAEDLIPAIMPALVEAAFDHCISGYVAAVRAFPPTVQLEM